MILPFVVSPGPGDGPRGAIRQQLIDSLGNSGLKSEKVTIRPVHADSSII